MSKKVALRKPLLPLLEELERAMQKFNSETEVLANRETSNSVAVHTGAARETTKAIIMGIAWRINKASKGLPTDQI